MTEELTSSQELALSLPLSQEVFSDIFMNQIQQFGNLDELLTYDTDCKFSGIESADEKLPVTKPSTSCAQAIRPLPIQVQPIVTSTLTQVSCLPAVDNWSGDLNFNVSFPCLNEKKVAPSVYSAPRDKLYVEKGVPCPINFSIGAQVPIPDGLTLRTQAFYTQPEHSNDPVKRCINHMLKDQEAGIENPEYLIRCECNAAEYKYDEKTGQFSVVVPFQLPEYEQRYATYIFKFCCYTSCAGGLNRRPIRVVFTLENNGVIVGRRSLPLKICACPTRDCRNDDKQVQKKEKKKTEVQSKKRKVDHDYSASPFGDLFQFIGKVNDCAKKSTSPPNKDGTFTITVKDRAEYDFLRHARLLYRSTQYFSPEILECIKSLKKMKKEESTDTE